MEKMTQKKGCEFVKKPTQFKPINLKLQYSENLDKKNKEIWTLIKLKNGKYRVVSPTGKIIKIDEVYSEEA